MEADGRRIKRRHNEADVDDITVNILSRLPIKSLMRFRCVRKSWRSLFSNPYFLNKLLSRHGVTATKRLLFFELNSPRHPRTIDFEARHDGDIPLAVKELITAFPTIQRSATVTIMGSGNGLICLHDGAHGTKECEYYLWNPSTGDTKKLPKLRFGSYTHGLQFHAFVYDSSTDDYKLFLGWRRTDYTTSPRKSLINVDIFSLKMGSWRTVEDDFAHVDDRNSRKTEEEYYSKYDYVTSEEEELWPEEEESDDEEDSDDDGDVPPYWEGCSVNGAVHWLLQFKKERDMSLEVVSFDLREEKFRQFSHLKSSLIIRDAFLGTFRDCLCCFIYGDRFGDRQMSIHIMEEYGADKSWTNLMQFSTYILPWKISYLERVFILENLDVLFLVDQHLVIYHPMENKYRTVWENPDGRSLRSLEIVMY